MVQRCGWNVHLCTCSLLSGAMHYLQEFTADWYLTAADGQSTVCPLASCILHSVVSDMVLRWPCSC